MSWIERIIAEALERGDLEPHEGVGEPIPDLDKAYDPAWWAKDWVQRERLRDRSGRGPGPASGTGAGPGEEAATSVREEDIGEATPS